MPDDVRALRSAIDPLIDENRPVVLAVSGGRDSMCLLDVMAQHPRRGDHVVVACFDHGTGPHAREAANLAAKAARAAGFTFRRGVAARPGRSEAEWRAARWSFLQDVARRDGGVVVTAHHRDDHVETVVMRLLRGAGARGLAGLRASPPAGVELRRPWLDVERQRIARYAVDQGVRWVDDPTNDDTAYFRNRVRRDLLPALATADAALSEALDEISRRAAGLREDVDRLATRFERGTVGGVVHVDPAILDLPVEGRALLWGAILQRSGVVVDRRGYARLAALATMRAGDEVQLSGRVSVTRTGNTVGIHRPRREWQGGSLAFADTQPVRLGPWEFAVCDGAAATETWGAWGWPAPPPGVTWTVRPWRGGDRWRGPGCQTPRLVARFLAESGVPASAREGWPVVETNGEIVWVPGTRRAPAAPTSPGGVPRLVRCEFIDR